MLTYFILESSISCQNHKNDQKETSIRCTSSYCSYLKIKDKDVVRGCADTSPTDLFQEINGEDSTIKRNFGCVKLENGTMECRCNTPKCNYWCQEKEPCMLAATLNTAQVCGEDCKSIETIRMEKQKNATKTTKPTIPPTVSNHSSPNVLIEKNIVIALFIAMIFRT